jgi:ssDNA-binding Zn-finger/Zn-ribbon topoisomerase 1
MAEKLVVTCPECAEKFKPKGDVRGKKILCPFCGKSFAVSSDGASSTAIQAKGRDAADAGTIPLAKDADTIPLAKDELGSSALEGDAPVSAHAGDHDDFGDDAAYGVTHIDLDPRCPNCTEKMKPRDAVVCLNCGYNTLTREWGKTEKTIGVSFGRQFVYLVPGFLAFFVLLTWIILELIFAVCWPHWVAGESWIDWTDYEGFRMWSVTVGMALFYAMARTCYRRFIVKPIPDELVLE